MKKETEQVDWLKFENEAYENGYACVCGVDEAGRGPLAGPVFAAAVVLGRGQIIDGVNDSKNFPKRKERFFLIR